MPGLGPLPRHTFTEHPGEETAEPQRVPGTVMRASEGQQERREGTVSLGREESIQEEAGLGSSHRASF